MVSGRTSDIRPQEVPEDDGDTTFVLPLPGRDFISGGSGHRGQTTTDQDDEERGDKEQAADVGGLEINMSRDVDMRNPTLMRKAKLSQGQSKGRKAKKSIKVSRHGIQYPLLPVGVVKKLAMNPLRMSRNSNAKLSKDTLNAIMQASDWFFEQASDDLGVYAEHAGRKTIDETDVVMLMRR
jgi:histone H3/H4